MNDDSADEVEIPQDLADSLHRAAADVPAHRPDIAAVRHRAAARSRQRRVLTGAAAAIMVVALVGTGLVVADDGDQRREQVVAGQGEDGDAPDRDVTSRPPRTSTTTVPTNSTSSTTAMDLPVLVPPPSDQPTTSQPVDPVPSTTATTTPCRNSTDAACGLFRWDPAPTPNRPMSVEVTTSPSAPRAGDTVTFSVVVTDPDAQIQHPCDVFVSFGAGDDAPPACASSRFCEEGYGAWSPPERKPDRREDSYTHVYEEAGTYLATFQYVSWSASTVCEPDPYSSNARGQIEITVAS